MRRQWFTLSVYLLAFGVSLNGCKRGGETAGDSRVNTPVALTASPTPQKVVIIKPLKWKQPPPLASMIPVQTIAVQPPASFGSDQLAKGKAVEFVLSGSAGQFLRVNMSERFRVSVQPPDGSEPLHSGGDSTGNWFYALPQTGTYRIKFAPVESPSIKFSFLASDDPMADPGIQPEQISIDFGAFAQGHKLMVAPYELNEDVDYPDSWPTHLAMVKDDFEFRIMTVEGYKRIFSKDHTEMDAFEEALAKNGGDLKTSDLPYSSFADVGILMWTRRQWLTGPGWHGLRWIADFGQDYGCALNLSYLFEGLSNDGRFFILLRAKTSNPDLEKSFSKQCDRAVQEGGAPGDDDLFQQAAAGASPGSFYPNLDQLDAVIRSLKLK